MLGPEDADRISAGGARKNYLRSVSWTDRSPSRPNPRPPSNNNKARLCLPPLQPLSVTRQNMEEWPKAGSDDLGVWPSVQTPRGTNGEPIKNSEKPPREFQFKKDKLAFFDKECSKIAEHIYLGSDAVAKNREVLRQNGITHVLNCVGFVSPEYFKRDLVYKTLWLQDSPSEDITSILYDVFDYFEDVREQGGRVLVHCCQGVSRSTSLVIAYLMWREGQSFDDAFQYVKAARGVTNPNMGFACQLLQHQKRGGNVVPASPGSVLRMYRMAPHSPYDPLHLVPKLLNDPSVEGLDSRGAFIVHVPSAIYVWIGKDCKSVMLSKAMVSAFQVIRYERAQGPIMRIKEGEEPIGFWDALTEEAVGAKKDAICWVDYAMVGSGRTVEKYDLDFEIFHKALAGGIVPPSSLYSMDSETCLPARENGWDRLRQKFASGEMKEFVTSTKLLKGGESTTFNISTVNLEVVHGTELDDTTTTSPPSTPSTLTYPCGSPDSFSCFLNSSPERRIRDTNFVEEEDQNASSFCNSPDSFSCIPTAGSPIFSSKSPTLSPSSEYSGSSFTFSPSSSNWSDLPYLSSQQPSPSSGLEPTPYLLLPVIKYVKKQDNSSYVKLHKKAESFASDNVPASPLPCKGGMMVPSIAERRGSNPPARVLLPSSGDEQPHGRRKNNLVRSWSFSLDDLDDDEVMNDVDCGDQSEDSEDDDAESLTLATEHSLTPIIGANGMQIDNEHRKNCDVFNICSCTDNHI